MQKEYFDSQGINAWVGQVPFYITTNPVMANTYAHVTLRYIQDHIHKKAFDPSEPFYIVELATGSGKFSFFAMKRLFELQKILGMDHVKICYVMTDFTGANLKFWEAQPNLAPFLEQGKLDFALFDLETSKTLELIRAKKTYGKGSLKNPLTVYANYTFDTVSHDAFHVKNGHIQEALVRTTTSRDNLVNKKPVDMEKLETSFEYQGLRNSHYKDEHLNAVLATYQELLQNSTFLMPIGGIRSANSLGDISSHRFLVLSTDKGYTFPFELEGLGDPRVVFHGSFSMMVNFHALGEYFKQRGGDCLHQSKRSGIKTSVFLGSGKLTDLPETSEAINNYIAEFSPADFFIFHSQIRDNKFDTTDLELLLAHMHLCHWDPHIFRLIAGKINDKINETDPIIREGFIEGMPNIAANFYYMPNNQDTMFEIGVFFHTLQDYQQALYYYSQSTHYFGQQFSVVYNKALCEYNLSKLHEALESFKEAHILNRDSIETKEWIERIEKELT
jgi:tetratricopeptide (TPR) repeat protein